MFIILIITEDGGMIQWYASRDTIEAAREAGAEYNCQEDESVFIVQAVA